MFTSDIISFFTHTFTCALGAALQALKNSIKNRTISFAKNIIKYVVLLDFSSHAEDECDKHTSPIEVENQTDSTMCGCTTTVDFLCVWITLLGARSCTMSSERVRKFEIRTRERIERERERREREKRDDDRLNINFMFTCSAQCLFYYHRRYQWQIIKNFFLCVCTNIYFRGRVSSSKGDFHIIHDMILCVTLEPHFF